MIRVLALLFLLLPNLALAQLQYPRVGTPVAPEGAANKQYVDDSVVSLNITRNGIATSTKLTQQTIVIAGCVTLGDQCRGSRYVRGSSAGLMAIQDANSVWWELDISSGEVRTEHLNIVAGSGGNFTYNAASINAAMARLDAVKKAGRVIVQPGDIFVNATLDNKYARIFVDGPGQDRAHDVTAVYGASIIAAFNGTVLRHRTPTHTERGIAAAANWKNTGGGFRNIRVHGNGFAPRILHVTSISGGEYTGLVFEEATGTEAVLFDTLIDYRDAPNMQMGEAADNQHFRMDMEVRQSNAADGVVFSGVPSAGNTSVASNLRLVARVNQGIGFRVVNADNIHFEMLGTSNPSGLGWGFRIQAALAGQVNDNITFGEYRGVRGYVEGTADRTSSVTPGELRIINIDASNGTPVPTKGANAKLIIDAGPVQPSIGQEHISGLFAAGATLIPSARLLKESAAPAAVMAFGNGGPILTMGDAGTTYYVLDIESTTRQLRVLHIRRSDNVVLGVGALFTP